MLDHPRPALVGGEGLREREGERTSVEVMGRPAQAGEDHLELPPDPPPELPPSLSQRSTVKRKAQSEGQEDHHNKKHHG